MRVPEGPLVRRLALVALLLVAAALVYLSLDEPRSEERLAVGPKIAGRYRLDAPEPLVLRVRGSFDHDGGAPPRLALDVEHRYLERGTEGLPFVATMVLNGEHAYEFRYDGDHPIDMRWSLPTRQEELRWTALREGSNDVAWFVNGTPRSGATGQLYYETGPILLVR